MVFDDYSTQFQDNPGSLARLRVHPVDTHMFICLCLSTRTMARDSVGKVQFAIDLGHPRGGRSRRRDPGPSATEQEIDDSFVIYKCTHSVSAERQK